MKNANITKTIFLIAIIALMQFAIFAQKAELVVQTGHTNGINSVAFSPDGKLLVSGGTDDLIKLWDAESEKELKTFKCNGAVFSVAFSPDGTIVASGNGDGTVVAWNILNDEARIFAGHTNVVTSISFSPDGKVLASSSWDKTIKLWNVETGKEIKTLTGHLDEVKKISFSPTGKKIASAGKDGSIKLWDVFSGNDIMTLQERALSVEVKSLAFNPVYDTLVTCGSGNIKFWDLKTGLIVKTIAENNLFTSVAISPNGKILATSGNGDIIKLWDAESGNEIKSFGRKGKGISDIESLAFSPDGKTLASASSSGSDFSLWMKSIYRRETLAGDSYVSPKHTIIIWDVSNGKESKIFSSQSNSISSTSFSPDGKTLAFCGSYGTSTKLWDLASGKELKRFSDENGWRCEVTFAPNGRTLVTTGGLNSENSIKLWDVEKGTVIKSLTKSLTGNKSSAAYFVTSLAFSPNGKILACGDYQGGITLWDLESGKELRTIPGHTDEIYSVVFSADGNTLASGSNNDFVKIWDVASGKELKSFSADTSSTTKNELVKNYPNLVNDYENITESDKFFAVPIHSQIFLFNKKTKSQVGRLVPINENDWAIVDPEGRFDASNGAQKLMHFVVGLEPVDLEQIKDRYYTPNLLQRIFNGENLDATRKVSVFTADELYPLAGYAPLKANETTVNVKLKNRGGGIGRVQVFVNGSEFLADARPKGFDPKSKTAELKIDFSSAKTLKKGEPNSIKIIARNEAGWLRNRGSEIVYFDERKKDDAPQDFYAIIGGVSDYENAAFNLQYSAKDARDFAKAVELGAAKLFGEDRVHIRLLASGAENENAVLTGADSKTLAPTKENFRRTFEEFRKAKPTDVLVVYLAGHGTSVNRGGDTGDTYLYLTQEAVTTDISRLLDEKLRNATTVSSEELAEWIKDVPALKRAMILDTCAAGAVEASLVKPRKLSSDQIKALDRMKDRTGFYVLMGSAADAQSYEATPYAQGLLTYSLMQGMSGAKLRDGEYADVSALFDYATDRVTEMAEGIGGIQQPRIIAPTESRSFDIGRFSTLEKSKFTLAKVKPLILQPRLSNDKLKFDDLKLSQTIAKALRDESSTISRGRTEAKLVFVEAEEMNDAITPSGAYEIAGDQIKVTLVLVKNNEAIKTLTIEGSLQEKEELSKKIIEVIIENAPN